MEIDLTDSPSTTSVSTPTDGGLHLHKRRRTDDPAFDRDDSSRTDPEGEETEVSAINPIGINLVNQNAIANGSESSRAAVVLSEPPQWQKVIEKAVKAIVSIRFSQVSAFDTEGNDPHEPHVALDDREKTAKLRLFVKSTPWRGLLLFLRQRIPYHMYTFFFFFFFFCWCKGAQG